MTSQVADAAGLVAFNALPAPAAEQALLECCSSPRWAAAVAAGRPYAAAEALYATADEALAALSAADLDAALAGHPRIGEGVAGAPAAGSSGREQAGVAAAAQSTRKALADGNLAYEQRFGHVYLVCADGRTGEQLLATLHQRLGNHPATERAALRGELGKINRIRLRRLLLESPSDSPNRDAGTWQR